MSDPESLLLFAPRQSARFGLAVAAQAGVELAPVEEREFDGGEHKMRPRCEVRDRHVFVVQAVHGDTEASANDRLCRLLFFIGALKDAGARQVTACVPYLAYARKDRRTQPQDPVTTRYVAAMFAAAGCDRVVVLDIHNESAFDNAFRCETVRLEAAPLFAAAVAEGAGMPGVVMSPDSGGVKRAERLRVLLEESGRASVGFAFMHKLREHGQLSGDTLVGEVSGANVVIHDDLIASGATVLRAVRAARAAGARSVQVVATHPAFTPAALALFGDDGPDQVIVTDSLPLPGPCAGVSSSRLRVISAAPLVADCIVRLHRGASLAGIARTG